MYAAQNNGSCQDNIWRDDDVMVADVPDVNLFYNGGMPVHPSAVANFVQQAPTPQQQQHQGAFTMQQQQAPQMQMGVALQHTVSATGSTFSSQAGGNSMASAPFGVAGAASGGVNMNNPTGSIFGGAFATGQHVSPAGTFATFKRQHSNMTTEDCSMEGPAMKRQFRMFTQ